LSFSDAALIANVLLQGRLYILEGYVATGVENGAGVIAFGKFNSTSDAIEAFWVQNLVGRFIAGSDQDSAEDARAGRLSFWFDQEGLGETQGEAGTVLHKNAASLQFNEMSNWSTTIAPFAGILRLLIHAYATLSQRNCCGSSRERCCAARMWPRPRPTLTCCSRTSLLVWNHDFVCFLCMEMQGELIPDGTGGGGRIEMPIWTTRTFGCWWDLEMVSHCVAQSRLHRS
jgi:hypothetical protein